MTPLLAFVTKLLVIALPIGVLARLEKIYPHTPLVFLFGVPAVLSIALIGVPTLLPALIVVDVLTGVVAVMDLFTIARRGTFVIERDTGRIASLGKRHRVNLSISNKGRRCYFVRVRDDTDPELQAEPSEFRLLLDPRSLTEVHYQLHPERRGLFELDRVHVVVRSKFGLWLRYLEYPVHDVVHVYPDMVQVSQYAVMARTNRLSLLGVRRSRRVGGDNEFERLRDYTRDDNYRHIDWRTTARRGKLTVKDFQSNQSQRLIFLIDCGRMMTNRSQEGLSLLDHSLNAALMLGYVALSRGDQVGLLTFSDDIHGYVPPKGGMQQMNRLLHESFNRHPRLVESRYDKAFLYLSAHCRKRSLVILLTNLIDEVNGNQVEEYLTTLVGRHLPMGVLLRDRRIFEYAEAPELVGTALYRAAAAADILSWRLQVLRDLESKGALTLDVFPDQLTAPLINRYLDIKARHML